MENDVLGRRARTVGTAALVAVAMATWGVLVWFAIVEGRALRSGQGSWALLLLASLAAVGCLYAALVLLVRLRRAPEAPAPPRARGGRHLTP